uniref:Uncharacterized protein n=1 Tax=Vibrio parahaemolyticus TaxID=670 RepID=A0A0C5GXJ8_VIBPH|nr:hypothetical protein pVPH1_0205 [Vibrio parahaemolyticus]
MKNVTFTQQKCDEYAKYNKEPFVKSVDYNFISG